MRGFAVMGACVAMVVPGSAVSSPVAKGDGPILFSRTGEHGRDVGELYVVNADGTGRRNLTRHPGDDQYHQWSPDGQRIVFARQWRRPERRDYWTNIYVMNANGSGLRMLTRTPKSTAPAWSPDGKRIAYLKGGALHVMNADGTGARPLLRRRLYPLKPIWSAAGKLAFIHRVDVVATEIWTVNAEGTGLRRVTRIPIGDETLSWSPSGDRLAYVRRRKGGLDLVAALFVVGENGGTPKRITPWSTDTLYSAAEWSPDGTRIAFVGRGGLSIVASDGGRIRRITRGGSPSWSPDGSQLAFTRHPGLFVINADGTGERRIVPRAGRPAFSLGESWSPSWSPK